MPIAWNLVPPRFDDGRHEAIADGLRVAGFDLRADFDRQEPGPGDLLVTWNLHQARVREAAVSFAQAGRPVIVCEEAYSRRLWAMKHFAMALDGHNGAGRWYPRGRNRWRRMGIAFEPWRRDGKHILVCAARGMGSPEMAEPSGWAEAVCQRLTRITARPIRLRRHPGKPYRRRPLERDLEGAWAVVVWGSSSAVQALVAGLPVFFEAPHIIVEDACERGIKNIDRPSYGNRLPAFEALAWAQWSLEEIAAGEPFRHLLQQAERAQNVERRGSG